MVSQGFTDVCDYAGPANFEYKYKPVLEALYVYVYHNAADDLNACVYNGTDFGIALLPRVMEFKAKL